MQDFHTANCVIFIILAIVLGCSEGDAERQVRRILIFGRMMTASLLFSALSRNHRTGCSGPCSVRDRFSVASKSNLLKVRLSDIL